MGVADKGPRRKDRRDAANAPSGAVERPRTLDVLRHGVEMIGLKQKLVLAQFKPALAMNPEILARYAAKPAPRSAAGALLGA